MGLIQLIVVLVIVGVGLYFLEQLPMDANVRTLIRVVVILACLLFLLEAVGVLPGGSSLRLR